MNKNIVCTLDKHYILLVNNDEYSYYIAIPRKEFKETNISITLRTDYENYIMKENNVNSVITNLNALYQSLDSYNITLVLPIFKDNTLIDVRDNNKNDYQKLDKILGKIINSAYQELVNNDISVNYKLYVINNDSYKDFFSWFVDKYSNRVEYKTLLELMRNNNLENTYNILDTPNINFIVGKQKESPLPEVKADIPSAIEDIIERNKEIPIPTKKEYSYGYASYCLLGVITVIVSFIVLSFLVK